MDFLSALPDGIIGHILSFLPAEEAARAAVLSTRWRHSFAGVHTLSFVQEEGSSCWCASNNDYNYGRNAYEHRNADFVRLVDAAFSCRRRCSGGGCDPALRAFRVKFDSFHDSLAGDVDRWLSAVIRRGGATEIYIDARRPEQCICRRELNDQYYDGVNDTGEIKDESDGEDATDFRNPETRDRSYRVPRELYSPSTTASLQDLCLGSCFLDLPPGDGLCFPSVEKLMLIWIPDSGRDIERLVSACPRLADLKLDSCRRVRAITVLDKRLRKLTLRCCHGARVTIDASDLREVGYKGPVPDESVLSFVGSPPVVISVDIEFCGQMTSSDDIEPVNVVQFLRRFKDARWLRLSSFYLGSGLEKSNHDGSLPQFLSLRHLELMGTLMDISAIVSVMAVLKQTPNLESLTLLIKPDRCDHGYYFWHEIRWKPDAILDVPGVLPVVPCLRDRLREINVVHYQGTVAHRKLLKLLILRALRLDEVYVVFPKAKFALQTSLIGEIRSWVINRPIKVMFT